MLLSWWPMRLQAVRQTAVTFSSVTFSLCCLFAQITMCSEQHCSNCLRATKYSQITPKRKTFYWLTIQQCCTLKTDLLVYKCLHMGFPKWSSACLNIRQSTYNNKYSNSHFDGVVLDIAFAFSVMFQKAGQSKW